jgi:hypothetical protein
MVNQHGMRQFHTPQSALGRKAPSRKKGWGLLERAPNINKSAANQQKTFGLVDANKPRGTMNFVAILPHHIFQSCSNY